MRCTTRRALRRALLATVGMCLMLPAGTASAGRLIATGHDADHHCGREATAQDDGPAHAQCHFFRVAVDYVRAGAPDPAKPVLVLDRKDLDVVAALDFVYGPGVMPRTVVDPRSSAFQSVQISTALYSAVIIASSGGHPEDPTQQDLNERDGTPDSDAINARAADLRRFFDEGGGLYANSGSVHGDGPGDPYYGFLPLGVTNANVVAPFKLTPAGAALGFSEDDVVCCPTHNTFEPPSPDSALRGIDTDATGRLVTIFADTPRFASLGEAPIGAQTVQDIQRQSLPTAGNQRSCVRRRSVTLRLKRPKRLRYSRATVYRNGKRIKRLRGRNITRPLKIAIPKRSSVAKIRVVIVTTGKQKITIRRTYKVCATTKRS